MLLQRFFGTLVVSLLLWDRLVFADDATQRREQRLQAMKRRAEALKFEQGDKRPRLLQLRAEPIMRFDDPTRDFYDGTLWAWCDRGRPQVLGSVEKYENIWAYELISLSDEAVAGKLPTGEDWTPKPALAVAVFADAAVGESPTTRRAQARELSRRFEMAEYVGSEGKDRTVLRLVPRPIYEYDDEHFSVLSGALFVYANGTNPEVLLRLEALEEKKGKPAWHYCCAPLSTARLEAKMGSKVVWEAAKFRKPDFSHPYVAIATPLEQDPDSEAEK